MALRRILLLFAQLVSTVHAASIHINSNDLAVSIKLDAEYSNNLYGETHLRLEAGKFHIVELSNLWAMFDHLLPQIQDGEYFSVLAIHSFEKNISLCKASHSKPDEYRFVLNGTSLGLVLNHFVNDSGRFVRDSPHNEFEHLCLFNPHKSNLTVLLHMNLYDQFQPVPGGCNIEFELENSPFIIAKPFQRFAAFDDYAVNFQPGSPSPRTKFDYKSFKCNLHITGERLRYRLYAFYDDFRHLTSDEQQHEHFRILSSMSHLTWVKNNARLIAEIKHESSLGRIYILTASSLSTRRVYFNVLLSDLSIERTEVYEDEFYYSSLYVPVGLGASDNESAFDSFEHSFNLCFTLVSLALFSAIVALLGFRYFILEVFYFSFLQIFATLLCCMSSTHLSKHSHSSKILDLLEALKLLPSVSTTNLVVSLLVALVVSSVWTELCRRSRNIKLALSGHCMILSSIVTAILFDAILIIDKTTVTILVSDRSIYLLILFGLMVSIVLFYVLFILYLDLFWLSALSTAITTIYMILLPMDIFLMKGGILFRVLFNLWLLSFSSFFISPNDVIVSFITLNPFDFVTIVVFLLLVTVSIYWQTLTKLGALHTYGFGCIRPQETKSSVNRPSDSPSSSSPSTVITALSVMNRKKLRRINLTENSLKSVVCEKVLETHIDERRDFTESKQQSSSSTLGSSVTKSGSPVRTVRRHKHFPLRWTKNIRKKIQTKPKQRSRFVRSVSTRRRSGRFASIRKMYRCKYCHKLSNTKSGRSNQVSRVSLRRQDSIRVEQRKRHSYAILRREAERLRTAQIESINAVLQSELDFVDRTRQTPFSPLPVRESIGSQTMDIEVPIVSPFGDETDRNVPESDGSSVFEMDSLII